MRSRGSLISLVAASLLGAFLATGLNQLWNQGLMESTTIAQDAAREQSALSHIAGLSEGFKFVAGKISPSVVNITTVQRGTTPAGGGGLPPELEDLFGEEFGPLFGQQRRRPFETRGTGSGVLVTASGHILTNNHVVGGASEVTVRLFDDRQFEAVVVGTDPKTDLAVIKIDATNLRPAVLGDSDQIAVGEWVLAVGSPFQLSHSVTAGIISAKGRLANVTDYEDFLQTDAAINPGNSGGPLVNIKGEVVGINTAIRSETGSFAGIGFAIPANLARMVLDQIVKTGEVRRGRLGAHIQDLTPELAESYRYGSTDGVLIADVIEDSPAEKAGLKQHDIVAKLNGRPMRSASQFRNTIAATPPDTPVTLEVFRDNRRTTVKVVLDALDDAPQTAASGLPEVPIEKLGLRVATLTPEIARRLNIPDTSGAVIVGAMERGAARSLGLQPGDVIVEVDRQEIATAKDLADTMAKADLRRGVRMHVRRDGISQILFLRTGR